MSQIKFYFGLQIKRAARKLNDFGIHPIVAIVLSAILFVALSKYLFIKIEFAEIVYILVLISTILKHGERNRNNQLKSIFKKKDYFVIRCLENTLVTIPFMVYLIYEKSILLSFGILPMSLAFSFITFGKNINYIIPTPFKRLPFEFIVGFRKSVWLIIITLFLCLKGIQVDNYNLSAFCLGLLFFISISFYFKLEQKYFVWIFSKTSKQFLFKKWTYAIVSVNILTLPFLILLIAIYPEFWHITIAIQLIGLILLSSIIVAKYSAYPKEMNVIQVLLFSLCFWFPPMAIFIIPIFYKRAKRQLNSILS